MTDSNMITREEADAMIEVILDRLIADKVAEATGPLVAAAYEAAAELIRSNEIIHGADGDELRQRMDGNRSGLVFAAAIRDIATADARATLDRLIADKVAEATTPKPLVWNPFEAYPLIGKYRVADSPGAAGLYGAWFGATSLGGYPTIEAAKEAAQADYEARIRAALKGGAA